ncbi:sialidase family protein [Anaerolineales bacterium HSG25]|nr:sialidase family protein [Anaerolineales bacterium HSG25]
MLVFVGMIRPPVILEAQTSTNWSEPVMVSPKEPDENMTTLSYPDVATDLQGNAHLFWSGGRELISSRSGGYDTVVHCQIEAGVCLDWSETIALPWYAGASPTIPAPIIDSQNTVHLLHRGVNGEIVKARRINYEQVHLDDIEKIDGWSTPKPISEHADSSYSDILVDNNGILHATWSEFLPPLYLDDKGNAVNEDGSSHPCGFCAEIFYRKSTDYGHSWSKRVNVSQSAMPSDKHQLVIDDHGVLYLVWEEGPNLYGDRLTLPIGSSISRSTDGGRNWSKPTLFLFRDDAPQKITIGIDQHDHVVVVWGSAQNKGLYYQVSRDKGLSWSPAKRIPDLVYRAVNPLLDENDGLHMVANGVGHLHLVFVGQQRGDEKEENSVFHLSWDGQSWSEPNRIFKAKMHLPERPRIAVGNGNQLHVTWLVRNSKLIEVKEQDFKVWYASGKTQTPAQTPVAKLIATVTPTSSPTPVTPTPTVHVPTVTPTVDPEILNRTIPTGAIESIYTDYDDIAAIMVSIAPAAIIIVLVVTVVRLARRRKL